MTSYISSLRMAATEIEDRSDSGASSNQEHGEGGVSFCRYIFAEISRGYLMEEDEQLYSEKQRRVSTFMKTPRELEKLMLFGFCICADSFLFIYTFLPFRVLLAVLKYAIRIITCSRHRLEAAQKCDLMRASILAIITVVMMYVDTSAVYHIVRGQSVIKLYVIYNMLDIFDRLLASIGQDTLDTLYWMAAESKSSFETLFYFIIANVYVLIHTSVVLIQTVTLNVAINSHSKALLTILVSNNFVELKGSVFKKFETNNLFQMSCSDIRERFHYVILLMIVCVRNLAQFNWDIGYLENMVPIIALVFASEILVDWIKHAFITKFNDITPDVYQKYRAILSRDLATSRHKNAKSDHSDLVSRRMGFIPLPLGCLVWRTLSQSFSFPGVRGAVLLVIIYLCLTALKILIGIVLLGKACKYRYSDHTPPATEEKMTPPSPMTPLGEVHRRPGAQGKTKQGTKSLQDIERYTLCSNRIV